MNEPWEEELKPDSVKKVDEVADRNETKVTIPIVSVKCNWDDCFEKWLHGLVNLFRRGDK
jgi:hypothetical protein